MTWLPSGENHQELRSSAAFPLDLAWNWCGKMSPLDIYLGEGIYLTERGGYSVVVILKKQL